MATQLFHPARAAKQLGKYFTYGAIAGIIPMFVAANSSPFEPTDHVGFPAGSMGDNYLTTLQTGDLLLFNQPQYVSGKPVKWFFSQLQKLANHDEYEHIGVVVCHPTKKYPYVLEKGLFGTLCTPFEDRIAHTKSQDIMLRTLHILRTPDFQKRAQDFVSAEFQLEDQAPEGAITRTVRWLTMLKNYAGICSRDFGLKKHKPSAAFNIVSMEEITSLQFSDSAQNKSDYNKLLDNTSKHASSAHIVPVPITRVIQYAELTSTLRQLRTTEKQLTAHLIAQDARLRYENAVCQHELDKVKKAMENRRTKLPTLPSDTNIDDSALPPRPANSQDELLDHDLMALLQKRDLLYDDFETQFDAYRKATIDAARFGMYMPLYKSTTPAFPDAACVTRLYQHLNLIPNAQFNHLSVSDIVDEFPISVLAMDEEHRQGEFDLRKFDFGLAFQVLTKFAPTPNEYRPHNFRLQNPLYLAQGVLGEEQNIVHSFNKPPIEYRTGSLARSTAGYDLKL